jgi:tRNA(Ile2) C34 agmatinyltransferase TiaS
MVKIKDLIHQIDTVHGVCPECKEDTILVAIVTDYYRCTSCGEDTRQYINGSIKYLRISDEDKKWLKRNKSAQQKS